MDCCGHVHSVGHHHQGMWGHALASIAAMLAGETRPRGSTKAAKTAEEAAEAVALLRRSISVDVHTHGGKTEISSKAPPSGDLSEHMREGSLAVACLADVPDGPILGRHAAGTLSALRTPMPGELYRHHLERLAWMGRRWDRIDFVRCQLFLPDAKARQREQPITKALAEILTHERDARGSKRVDFSGAPSR